MTLRGAANCAVALLLACALGACATAPTRTGAGPAASVAGTLDAAADWPARRSALLALDVFSLRGRVAVAAVGEGFSAGLRWSQRGTDGQMQLTGPLGAGGLRAEFTAGSMHLTDAHGDELNGEAARAELERRLGFELPLAQLAYWVRGVAAPDATAAPAVSTRETLDATAARLAALEQSGWHIDYSSYAPAPPGLLPSKLVLRREGVRIRLVVDAWESP